MVNLRYVLFEENFRFFFLMIITIKFCTVVTQFATKIFALIFGSKANALLCHI